METRPTRTLQFSTSVEVRVGIVGSWLVGRLGGYPLSQITALRILPKLGMELEGDELGTVTEPVFPEKF